MTGSASFDTEIHRLAETYCRERQELSFCSCEIHAIKTIDRETWIFLERQDKRCPQLFLIRGGEGGSTKAIIPHFLIRERPCRQLVSYFLGKGLCNLAEIKELFGRLYSRYCGSYTPEELPHRKEDLSRIALWTHDCLTEDFDHQTALNRQNLEEGASVSYDFGMAFSNHYFPPFYTMELGIADDSIRQNRLFLLDMLTRYARWIVKGEERIIQEIEASYPTTNHRDRCRYYLRNYKTCFRTRLYFGRFFEKLRGTPFEKQRLSEMAQAVELDLRRVSGWQSLIETLRSCPRGRLDLRGLDLSDMDLRRADLRGADLEGAGLAGADLEDADMRGANLSGVDLTGAHLKGAKLEEA